MNKLEHDYVDSIVGHMEILEDMIKDTNKRLDLMSKKIRGLEENSHDAREIIRLISDKEIKHECKN